MRIRAVIWILTIALVIAGSTGHWESLYFWEGVLADLVLILLNGGKKPR